MTEGWGMVVAAAIALIGVFFGLVIGRRTVRDQAHVEHGQWLRGQRQEAYVELIALWDELIPKFEGEVLSEDRELHLDHSDTWDEAGTLAEERLLAARAPFQRAAERVQMLGPDAVEGTVTAMLDTIDNLSVGIAAQFVQQDRPQVPLQAFWDAQGQVNPRRAVFLSAAREALRQTPDTKRS